MNDRLHDAAAGRSSCVACCFPKAALVEARRLREHVAAWILRQPRLCDACVRRLERHDDEPEETTA